MDSQGQLSEATGLLNAGKVVKQNDGKWGLDLVRRQPWRQRPMGQKFGPCRVTCWGDGRRLGRGSQEEACRVGVRCEVPCVNSGSRGFHLSSALVGLPSPLSLRPAFLGLFALGNWARLGGKLGL